MKTKQCPRGKAGAQEESSPSGCRSCSCRCTEVRRRAEALGEGENSLHISTLPPLFVAEAASAPAPAPAPSSEEVGSGGLIQQSTATLPVTSQPSRPVAAETTSPFPDMNDVIGDHAHGVWVVFQGPECGADFQEALGCRQVRTVTI